MMKRIPLVLLLLTTITTAPIRAQNGIQCTPLEDIAVEAAQREALDVFISGGDLVDNNPVILVVPRSTAPFTICLDNIKIPDSVSGMPCNAMVSNCYLLLGIRAVDDDRTSECADDANIAPCYNCVCQGVDFGSGVNSDYISDACGIEDAQKWATTCPNSNNNRGNSTLASAQFSVCGGAPSDAACNVCPGESQAPFQVRMSGFYVLLCCDDRAKNRHPFSIQQIALQWIANVEKPCASTPFLSGGAVRNAFLWGLGVVMVALTSMLM